MKTPRELADEHWEWLAGLWASLSDAPNAGVATTKYLYTTAFIHGYKHGYEQKRADENNVSMSAERFHDLIQGDMK